MNLLSELICWDANTAIYWFEGATGDATQEQLQKIKPIYEAIDSGVLSLVVPDVIKTEVTMKEYPSAVTRFEQFISEHQAYLDIQDIAVFAVYIRQVFNISTLKFKNDSECIATAILAGASYLQTFDKRMIKLSGHDVLGGLIITDDPIANGLVIPS